MGRPALLVLATLLSPGALAAQQGTAVLTGKVVETGTGRLLAGARVLLRGTLLATEADSAGRFRGPGLRAARRDRGAT